MKYRVRFDMSFDNETDAGTVMDYGKSVLDLTAVNQPGSETMSYCEMELCRHDEGLPCTLLERVEKSETG